MMKRTIGLAAALLLGGMATGYAQEGAPQQGMDMPSPGGNEAAGATGEPGAGAAQGERKERNAQPRQAQDKGRSAEKSAERAGAAKREGGQKEGSQAQKATPDEPAARTRKQAGTRDDDDDKADTAKNASESRDEGKQARDASDDAKDRTQRKADTDATDEDAGKRAARKTGDDDDGDKQADTGDRKAQQADLSGEKRDKVRNAFRGVTQAKSEVDVDIDVTIGRRLPRHLGFRPLPAAVIEIVPAYRGYVYVYADDSYVICDPDTYEVVAIVEASSEGDYRTTAARGSGDQCPSSLTLTDDEREFLLSSVRIEDEVDVDGVSVGWSVPGSIELRTFPGPVVSRYGKLGGCRYFVADDQIALVDPHAHKVVLLVEHHD